MIDLTVALPMYQSANIAWLALESLCRQEQVDFDWELIVAEEQGAQEFGAKNIESYRRRLEAVGCCKITYLPLNRWVPLSQKWALIGKKASESSQMFVCQADDNYAPPSRLAVVHHHLDYDYICYPKCYFYFIKTNEVYLHTIKRYAPGRVAKGLQYSFQTKYARLIPPADRSKIVDQWLYDIVKQRCGKWFKHVWITDDSWKAGFNTHGFHRLSDTRYEKFKGKLTPYTGGWPTDTMLRLQNLQNRAKL